MNNQWRDHANCTVVWADGTYDSVRKCLLCEDTPCNVPVHEERYRTVGQAKTEIADAEAASGYWEYMYSNQPHGSFLTDTGETGAVENTIANPDALEEVDKRTSGVGELEHLWMQEAHELLTPRQKEVWDFIMKDQMSQTEAAELLGITQQAVAKTLLAAKLTVTEYLRVKMEGPSNANS